MNRSELKRFPRAVLKVCALEWGLTPLALVSPWRTRDISQARSVACYMLYASHGFSYPQIAELVGMSSHSSALHAARRGEARLAADPELAARLYAALDATYDAPK